MEQKNVLEQKTTEAPTTEATNLGTLTSVATKSLRAANQENDIIILKLILLVVLLAEFITTYWMMIYINCANMGRLCHQESGVPIFMFFYNNFKWDKKTCWSRKPRKRQPRKRQKSMRAANLENDINHF